MNAVNKTLKEIEKNGKINTEEELNLLKTKKAISKCETIFIIFSIALYILTFITNSIPLVMFLLALSTPFIAHIIANEKSKKEILEIKIQIYYYMSFIWKFYVIIFVLLFSVLAIYAIVQNHLMWSNALLTYIPAIIVLSLPIFLDSKWWKYQYRSALLKISQNNKFKKPLPESTNNKYLNALAAQKEKVKQQNAVSIEKSTISDKWICTNCGEMNPLTAKFCKGCGTWNAAMNQQTKENEQISHTEEKSIQTEHKIKYCFKCGFKLKSDAKFCIMCGERQPDMSDNLKINNADVNSLTNAEISSQNSSEDLIEPTSQTNNYKFVKKIKKEDLNFIEAVINSCDLSSENFKFVKKCRRNYVILLIFLNIVTGIIVGGFLSIVSKDINSGNKQVEFFKSIFSLLGPLFLYINLRINRQYLKKIISEKDEILQMQTYYSLHFMPRYFICLSTILGVFSVLIAVSPIFNLNGEHLPIFLSIVVTLIFVAFFSIPILIYIWDIKYYTRQYVGIFLNSEKKAEKIMQEDNI